MRAFLATVFAVSLALPLCPPPRAEPAAPAPLPLPSLDGKALAITPGQKVFRLPLRFARVEAFYREQFKGLDQVAVKVTGTEGTRTLTLTSRRATDTWAKAVCREGEVGTTVEVTPVTRLDTAKVEGSAMPLVIVIPRSNEAQKAAQAIDHLQRDP